MNSLNLKQIDGGNIIKQADSGSLFKFELLDENHKKFEEQLGDTATVILKQGAVAVFKKIVAVTDNCVAFNLDKILEVGDYILEIIVGEYVFPSNNRLKISVESTYGDYQPENLVRITYEEIDEKINALTDRLEELDVAGQTEMMKRIEVLESKEDKDTVYDDTKIKNSIDSLKSTVEQNEVNVNQELLGIGQKQAKINDRLSVLESKEDKDTIYDDTEIKRRVSALEERPTVEPYDDSEVKNRLNALEKKEDHDTIYDDTELKERLSNLENKESQYVSKFSGLELKDSDLESRVYTLEQKEDKDTVYDDSAIVKRVEALEQKPDNDTVYNDTEIKQSVADVDTKVDNLSEKVTALEERPIVDTALTERVEALEAKEDKDTIYDDSNLKAQIVELQTALNTLVRRRPPMSFYMDRSDMSNMKAVFDNGCIMVNFPIAVYNYYYGYPGSHDQRVFHYYNLPGNLIKLGIGIVGIDSLKEESISNAIYYCNNTKILNPIYDSSQFNFDELVIREPADNKDYKLACQRNFVKIAYEIGALNEAEIIKLGAVKK